MSLEAPIPGSWWHVEYPQSRREVIGWTAAMLLVVAGIVDVNYANGATFALEPFYVAPVAIAGWRGGRVSAVILAVVATVGWSVANHAGTSVGPFIVAWNSATHLVRFLVVGLGFDYVSRTHLLGRAAVAHVERRLEDLVDGISDGLVETDAQSRITFANPAFAQICGVAGPAVLIGRSLVDLALPETRAGVASQLNRLLGNRAYGEVLLRARHSSGEMVTLQVRASPLVRDGAVVGARGIVQDVTARLRLEAERQRLSTAVEQAAESIIITDLAANITYVNPAFERITGYTSAEVMGQNPRILKSGKHDPEFYQRMWDTLMRGEPWRAHFINKTKGGSEYEHNAVIFPIRDAAGDTVSYVGIARDVTREVALEAQLRQSQKLEAIGSLAGGVAHDFNNLLTAIITGAELLAQTFEPGDTRLEDTNDIIQAGQRGATLTRQLLAFSRRQALEPKVIDLNEVITNLNRMLHRLIGEDVRIVTRLETGLGAVKADPGQLEQVVLNLAVNARDAMPSGGTLVIATMNLDLTEEYAEEHVDVVPGPYVALSVSDNGTGMTPEVKARIFEPFFTTKEVGRGTGLGLATVYGIVKQSGGSVWVYSEPGEGTTFRVYLPRLDDVAQHTPPPVAIADLHGTETVLVAEDADAVRTLVKRSLELQGYTVITAHHGAEALELARSFAGTIDLLLTDFIMPDMRGNVLADAIRAERPGIRVLCMSGYTETGINGGMMLPEGMAFLQKPFTPHALAAKVREVLDQPA